MMDQVVPKGASTHAARKNRRHRKVRRVASFMLDGLASAGCAWATVPCLPYVSYTHTVVDEDGGE